MLYSVHEIILSNLKWNWTNIFVGYKVILYTLVLSKYINQMLPSKLNRWFLFWIICQMLYSFEGKVTLDFIALKFEEIMKTDN